MVQSNKTSLSTWAKSESSEITWKKGSQANVSTNFSFMLVNSNKNKKSKQGTAKHRRIQSYIGRKLRKFAVVNRIVGSDVVVPLVIHHLV